MADNKTLIKLFTGALVVSLLGLVLNKTGITGAAIAVTETGYLTAVLVSMIFLVTVFVLEVFKSK